MSYVSTGEGLGRVAIHHYSSMQGAGTVNFVHDGEHHRWDLGDVGLLVTGLFAESAFYTSPQKAGQPALDARPRSTRSIAVPAWVITRAVAAACDYAWRRKVIALGES